MTSAADTSFPKPLSSPITVASLIERVDEPVLAIFGDIEATITSVASFDAAEPGAIVFLKDSKPQAVTAILTCPATLVIAAVATEKNGEGCVLHVTDPTRWFVKALRSLLPGEPAPEIHPTSVIANTARLGNAVSVGAHAVIEDDVVIGDGTIIGSGALIASGVRIGAACRIGANSVIGEHGLAMVTEDDGSRLAFPHVGSVVIGDRVDIGANCCVVRGILKTTLIGDGVKMANHVNIGHNCRIGDNCWISGHVIVCGSAELGSGVMVAAGAVIYNRLIIGDGARIGLGSVVVRPVASKAAVFGVPAAAVPFMRQF